MKDTEFDGSDEHKSMIEQYDLFYRDILVEMKEYMDDIYLQIDAKEESVEDKSGLTPKAMKQILTSISDSWKQISEEQCSERVKFILTTFEQYFVAKYIYKTDSKDKENQVDFVEDIFMNIFIRDSNYSPTQLLDDWEHVKMNDMKNGQNDFKSCKRKVDDDCIHTAVNIWRNN